MRELERDSTSDTPACSRAPEPGGAGPAAAPEVRLAVVGKGRLGSALAPALRAAGYDVTGPLGRGEGAAGATAALLCVPDHEIGSAAREIVAGVIVGHCSGATGLGPLGPREGFSLHPLMTVTRAGASFAGAGAAIAGSTPRALELAHHLASSLGMSAVEVGDEDRPAYHAAAAIASNFLITLEAAAEQLAATVGVEREMLVPLVRATVENWAALGPERALTGPIARGDEETVSAHREAVIDRAPELVELFDALTDATRALAAESRVVAS